MRTNQRILTAAAALLVAIALGGSAVADCSPNPGVISNQGALGTSQIFSRAFADNPNFYYGAYGGGAVNGCYYSAGCQDPLSPAANVTFWRLGFGDVAIGAGDDNGGFDAVANGQVTFAFPTYPAYYGSANINSGFGPGTDGCPLGNNCVCTLFTDSDGDNTYFAVVGSQSSATFTTTLDLGGSDTSGSYNAPIVLEPVPAPAINGSARVGTDVNLTVSVPAPGAGSYSKAGCNCAPTGFRVLQQIVPRGNMPPGDRTAGWNVANLVGGGAQGVTPIGMQVDIESICGAADQDVYLATELVFDSGFTAGTVSGNSSRVECGTNLANPDDRPRQRPGGIKPGRNNAPRGGRGR